MQQDRIGGKVGKIARDQLVWRGKAPFSKEPGPVIVSADLHPPLILANHRRQHIDHVVGTISKVPVLVFKSGIGL